MSPAVPCCAKVEPSYVRQAGFTRQESSLK